MSSEFDQENLLNIFVTEASDGMGALAKALSPDDGGLPTPQHLHDQFIIAHRIKGAAALYGYDGIANLCERLETLCEQAAVIPEDRWPAVVGAMREMVQGIQGMVSVVGDGGSEDPELIECCQALFVDLFPDNENMTASASTAPMAAQEYVSPVLDAVMQSYFVQEAEAYLSVIEGVVPTIREGSNKEASLALLSLTTHALSVAAFAIDFLVVGDIAQKMEGCVEAVQQNRIPLNKELFDVLISAVSSTRMLIRQDAAAMSRLRYEVPRLLDTLDRFIPGEVLVEPTFLVTMSAPRPEDSEEIVAHNLAAPASHVSDHFIAEPVRADEAVEEVSPDVPVAADPLIEPMGMVQEEETLTTGFMESAPEPSDPSFTEPAPTEEVMDSVPLDSPVAPEPVMESVDAVPSEEMPGMGLSESAGEASGLSFTDPDHTEEVMKEATSDLAVPPQAFSDPWLRGPEAELSGEEGSDQTSVVDEDAFSETVVQEASGGVEDSDSVVLGDASEELQPAISINEVTSSLHAAYLLPDVDEESFSHFTVEAEELLIEMEGLIQILCLDATGESIQYFTQVTRSLRDIAVAAGFQVMGDIAWNMDSCLTAVLEQRIPLNSELLDATVHGISLIRLLLQRDRSSLETLRTDIPILLDILSRLRGQSVEDESASMGEGTTEAWNDSDTVVPTEVVSDAIEPFGREIADVGDLSGEEPADLSVEGGAVVPPSILVSESNETSSTPIESVVESVGLSDYRGEVLVQDSPERAMPLEGPIEHATGTESEAVLPIVGAEYVLPVIDEEVLSYFVPEAEEYLAVIEELAPALRDASADGDATHRLFRATHTLKGSAYTVDFQVIGDIAHPMEDCMIAVREGRVGCSQELGDAFIAASALVRRVLQRNASAVGELRHEVPVLITILRQLCDGQTGMDIPLVVPVPVSRDLSANNSQEGRSHSVQLDVVEAASRPADTPTAHPEDYLLPELDPEVLSYFVPEAEEYLETLEANLLRLDKDPQNTELINQLFRTAHTLKGSAYTVGFQAIGDLVHHVEDFMGAVRDSRLHVLPGHTDMILRAVDVINVLMRRDPSVLESTRRRFETALSELMQLEQGHAIDVSPTGQVVGEVGQPSDRMPNLEEDDVRAVKQTEGKTGEERDVIRVSYARLERLMNLVGELVIGRGRLEQRLRMLEGLSDQVLDCKTRMIDSIQSFSEKHTFTFQSAQSNPDTAVVPQGTRGFGDFGGLELDKYDDFNILARRIGEVSADITEAMAQLSGSIGRAHEDMNTLQQLTRVMRDEIGRARMVPIGTPFTRFRRAIRETARALDKQVSLVTSGEHTEVDTGVVEGLVDPLVHLVRNAVYHGIESPGERIAKGKPSAGTIYLHAAHRGNSVVIEVEDDGGGLPLAKIREKAVMMGLVDHEQAHAVPDHEMFQYIFAPGFSTAEKVGDQAGRGVGLDVVKRAIDDMNGHIEVESESGVGTKFTLSLPLTLLITTALLVRVGNEYYAFALSNIHEVTVPTAMALEQIADRTLLRMEEEVIEVQSLRQILYREPTSVTAGMPIIIVRTSMGLFGLAVDELLGRQEIVIKTLGTLKPLTQSCFAGATIDPEGRVILVVDPSRLETRQATRASVSRTSVPAFMAPSDGETGVSDDTRATILLIDDSLSIRKFVGRMLESAGYPVDTAVDGDDGIKKASEKAYQLVITDLEMPKFNGYEVVQALRARPQTRQTPIVVMTTRAGDKHRQLAFDIGANSYIAKPVDERTLLGEVERWVGTLSDSPT